ncbi:MAG: orotate phosphoribosyltransferase [Leptospira sp.]|nr:orotate phosphoribosyltransferase [Leptospira sp.]
MKQFAYRYSEEEFTLASGKKSHHYFNCKEITLIPQRLQLLAEYLANEHIPDVYKGRLDAIGGLTLGSDPICYSVSLEFLKKGQTVYPLVVRKEAKGHGTKKEIEGYLENVRNCLVVDDVITTGGSTIKAVEALRRAGIEVNSGICILDREEGGAEALLEIGVTMHPIFRKKEFIQK